MRTCRMLWPCKCEGWAGRCERVEDNGHASARVRRAWLGGLACLFGVPIPQPFASARHASATAGRVGLGSLAWPVRLFPIPQSLSQTLHQSLSPLPCKCPFHAPVRVQVSVRFYMRQPDKKGSPERPLCRRAPRYLALAGAAPGAAGLSARTFLPSLLNRKRCGGSRLRRSAVDRTRTTWEWIAHEMQYCILM